MNAPACGVRCGWIGCAQVGELNASGVVVEMGAIDPAIAAACAGIKKCTAGAVLLLPLSLVVVLLLLLLLLPKMAVTLSIQFHSAGFCVDLSIEVPRLRMGIKATWPIASLGSSIRDRCGLCSMAPSSVCAPSARGRFMAALPLARRDVARPFPLSAPIVLGWQLCLRYGLPKGFKHALRTHPVSAVVTGSKGIVRRVQRRSDVRLSGGRFHAERLGRWFDRPVQRLR